MKHILLTLIIPTFLHGQPNKELTRLGLALLPETKTIMPSIGVTIRTALALDEPLVFSVSNKLKGISAKFTGSYQQNLSFKAPYIYISPLVNDILLKHIDTTVVVYLKAKSIIVHELVHYLQTRWDLTTYAPDYPEMNIPVELEAYSVGSFYFLREFNKRDELRKIMYSEYSIRRKRELLINAIYKYQYPKRKLIFDP